MIVFLQCNRNNRALTVLRLFQGAVETYSLPSRVRSDKGGGETSWLHCICSVIHFVDLTEGVI